MAKVKAKKEAKMFETMKKKRKKYLLIKIGVAIVIVVVAVQAVLLQVDIYNKRQRLDDLQQQLSSQQQENQQMQQQLDSGITDEYLADVAREKLGLVSPFERLFVDVN